MSSNTSEEVIAIALPKSQCEAAIQKIKASKNGYVVTKFSGDSFNTKLWLEGDKLMAKDPEKGTREVHAIESIEDTKVTSLKGLTIQLLTKEGFSLEEASEFACASAIKKLYDNIQNAKDPKEMMKGVNTLTKMISLKIALKGNAYFIMGE